MAWMALVMAGLCEMMGVYMISKYNKTKTIKNLGLLIFAFTLSFVGLAYAMETLPMGTAYAIWTGIGAAGEHYWVCYFLMNQRIGDGWFALYLF